MKSQQNDRGEQGWYEITLLSYLFANQHFTLGDGLLKSHILPAVLTLTAERVVATLKLHNLQLVLLSRNLRGAEFSHLGGECNEAPVAITISEDGRLKGVTRLLVDKIANLHLALHTSKSKERPTVLNADILSLGSHSYLPVFNSMTQLLV